MKKTIPIVHSFAVGDAVKVYRINPYRGTRFMEGEASILELRQGEDNYLVGFTRQFRGRRAERYVDPHQGQS
jgi:hypothetical protein